MVLDLGPKKHIRDYCKKGVTILCGTRWVGPARDAWALLFYIEIKYGVFGDNCCHVVFC